MPLVKPLLIFVVPLRWPACTLEGGDTNAGTFEEKGGYKTLMYKNDTLGTAS